MEKYNTNTRTQKKATVIKDGTTTLKMLCNNTLNKFNEIIDMSGLDDLPGDELPLKLCSGQYVAHPHRSMGTSKIKHFCNICGAEKWFNKAYPIIEESDESTEEIMDF